uniref:TEP isoform 2 n=1 Tax=Hirondellea gigas TaxID=1518452 RepID=A0A6A7FQK0_9CRUS
MGGFSSTQDTAVGLTALSALSQQQRKASGSNNNQLTVKLVYGERGHRFIINNNNARNPQTLVLPKDTRSIELSSSGDRRAIVQLSYHYNVQVTAPRPAFSLDPQLDRTTDTNKLRLTACTALRVRGNASEAEQSSNMAVMEVALPSGYLVDSDAIYGLYDYPGVKRVEWLRGEEGDGDMDTGLAIYFNGLTSREVCPTITASRVNRVAFQKPTVIKVYDYYDLTRQSRQFYDAAAATLCDICDIGECDSSACEVQILELNRQRQDPEDVGYPATIIETSAAAVLSWNAAFIAATALTATLLHLHMHANK